MNDNTNPDERDDEVLEQLENVTSNAESLLSAPRIEGEPIAASITEAVEWLRAAEDAYHDRHGGPE